MNLTLTSHFLWQAVRHTREKKKVRTLNHFDALFPNLSPICVQLEAMKRVRAHVVKARLFFLILLGLALTGY